MPQEIPPLMERDGALVNHWYIACLAREVPSDRPIQRIVYDQPLAIFRNADGRITALPDRCMHRHTLLSEGTLEKGELRCPYHGWKYNDVGKVTQIPSEGDQPAVGNRCLKPFPTFEQDDCVWVWMGKGPANPEKPPYRFPEYKAPGHLSYFMITDFENEVTHLAENFMDVPHTVFVHAKWFRDRSSKAVPTTVKVNSGVVHVEYVQAEDSIGFTERILNPRGEPMLHTDEFIFPNITRVIYRFGLKRAFVISSQITPVTTLKSRVYTEISYRLGPVANWIWNGFIRFYTRRVIEQDVRIMANQGRSFRFKMETDFSSTDADVIHLAIEKLRRLGIQDPEAVRKYALEIQKTFWI